MTFEARSTWRTVFASLTLAATVLTFTACSDIGSSIVNDRLAGTWQATEPWPSRFDERFTLIPTHPGGGIYRKPWGTELNYGLSLEGDALLLTDGADNLLKTYNFTLDGSTLTLENWGKEQIYQRVEP